MRYFVGVYNMAGNRSVWIVDPIVSHPLPPAPTCATRGTGAVLGDMSANSLQLAFALLSAVMNDDVAAVSAHKLFCRTVVSTLPRGGWVLSAEQVQSWVIAAVGVSHLEGYIELGVTEGGK